MNILVVGAGVVGSVYGSQLVATGHSVRVLAHGPSTDLIGGTGLVVRDMNGATGAAEVTPIEVVADAVGAYQLVLVCVWADQLASALHSLRGVTDNPVVLLFGNNPRGRSVAPADLPGTVRLGFPGIGGSIKDGIVEFVRIPGQPTTLERGGGLVVDTFEAALTSRGFATTRTVDMDGWLAFHGVFVASIAAALSRCHGDPIKLSTDTRLLNLMCRSIEEGFGAFRRGGVAGCPKNLRVLHSPWLRPIAVRYWARTMRSPMGEMCFAAHARRAESEMRALAADALERLKSSSGTDHFRELLR